MIHMRLAGLENFDVGLTAPIRNIVEKKLELSRRPEEMRHRRSKVSKIEDDAWLLPDHPSSEICLDPETINHLHLLFFRCDYSGLCITTSFRKPSIRIKRDELLKFARVQSPHLILRPNRQTRVKSCVPIHTSVCHQDHPPTLRHKSHKKDNNSCNLQLRCPRNPPHSIPYSPY
jgi:hypothetical protein